ncbi:MAG: hypothetical protein NUV76_12225 [Candidatus Kuenenia sp.]|nr:hypothetical protein [Candidatus Kuenenia sp.]
MATRVYGNEIFSQIKVSGQPNVDADSDIDALTLIAGSNITLTTDATNDTVTISTTGLAPTGSGAGLTGITATQVGLGNVENTALSTWAGSANITTLGAVTNITPGANFTLTQNSVAPFTSVALGAIANTLYLKDGKIGVNGIPSLGVLHLIRNGAGGGYSLVIENNNAVAGGDILALYKNSSAPVYDTTLGYLMYMGKNSAFAVKQFGTIRVVSDVISAGAEESSFRFDTYIGGTETPNTMMIKKGKIFLGTVGDSTGTPGNATLNTTTGKSAIAAAANAITITNNRTEATSLVFVTALDNDTTLTNFKAVASAGSFVVTGNAAATATWKFQWWIIN